MNTKTLFSRYYCASAARMTPKITNWFIKSSGLILAITGIGKVLSASGSARALAVLDPVFKISFRNLFLFVGAAELLISFYCLFTQKRIMSLTAIMWLSTNFLVYRINLHFIGWHGPCGCMGSFTQLLHLSNNNADKIILWVLAYLIAGSYILLFISWWNEKILQKA